MNVHDKISKKIKGESEEEKLYNILITEEYKEHSYETEDLAEGMSIVNEAMWGW